MKTLIHGLLFLPVALLGLIPERAARLWHFSRLRHRLKGQLDFSNVILGPVSVDGTGQVRMGRHGLIYPGVVLETQGQGQIILGDHVVLSWGVHIVAHERVEIGHGVLVGEYSALRDANHRWHADDMRNSGFDAAPVVIADNVWIGRCSTVLKGCQVGQGAVLAANSVLLSSADSHALYAGAPARYKKNLLTPQDARS
jgi:acetyltransferase-like isoleucine patch superfamily enzyme